jgi:opacity protein-like surface antigen
MIHRKVMVLLMLATMGVTSAADAAKVVLPRAGQVGIGMQGQYGTMLEAGDYGDLFSDGAGLAVRLRYRMRYERAIGLSFEGQTFDARVEGAPGDTTVKKLKLLLSGIEIYQMFDTRQKTHKNVSLGFGLAQASAEINSGETVYPDDGIYVSLGAGIEHFFWGSWAYDLSTRYMAIYQHQKPNHDFQVSLGLIYYASY